MCRMLRQDYPQCIRSHPLRPEGRHPPSRTPLRLASTCEAFPSHDRSFPALTPFQCLKPACATALRRIFNLNDSNKDGLLDATELNEFQVHLICVERLSVRHKKLYRLKYSANLFSKVSWTVLSTKLTVKRKVAYAMAV